jgi:asparagine synthase (glutamine-hydrolysing)
MCGIFGHHHPNGDADLSLVERMAQRLAHRGPDGYGTYRNDAGTLAFGAGRLAIIDLSAPAGPIFNEDGTIGVAFNGEIYNYRDLRRQLERDGHVFATDTDTEVIVHGYEQWGAAVVERLRGMFALAIWDDNEARLLLARDRAGEKPLYYARIGEALTFASEIKALLLRPNLTPTVNPDAIPHYLAVGYTPPPLTMFAGVSKLAPGEMLIVEAGELSTRTYWTPTLNTQRPPIPYNEAVAAVREAFTQAVEMRLMSDVPIGAFLSGGVDSTAVVALMAQATGQPVQTFTVGFDFADDPNNDRKFNVDQRFGGRAAQTLGTNHHEITVQMDEGLSEVFPHLVAAMDEPIAQHAIVQTAYVSALARVNGVPVLLSGDAADELFMGYTHYRADRVLNRYLRIPGLLRTGLLDRVLSAQPYSDGLRKLAQKSTHDTDPVRRYLAWMRVTGIDDIAELTSNRYIYSDAMAAVAASFVPLLNTPQTDHFTERIAYTSLRRWVAEDSNMRVDKMSMLMSVEARAPFEDHQLMDLALSLPMSYKLREGDFKRVLKDAVRGLVPDEVLERPKRGFAPPSSEWLRGALRPLVDTYLSPEYVESVGIFDPKVVQNAVQAHLSRKRYELWTVYPMLVFHLWHALYIDGSLTLSNTLTPESLISGAGVKV